MTTYQITHEGFTATVEASGFLVQDEALILVDTDPRKAVAAFARGRWSSCKVAPSTVISVDGNFDASKLVVEDGLLSGEPEAPRPPASADIDPGTTSTSAASGSPAAPAAASATPPRGPIGDNGPAEKPKRRRTKAQKEEDERDGLEEAFQKALKEHPNLDVDTIRDMIRGNREAVEAEAVAASHVADAPPEISSAGEDDGSGWDSSPGWGESPALADDGADADWTPNWG